MRYIWQHIRTIIDTYNGNIPLTHFLKSYFKQFPVLGSRDRKVLSEMAYNWYRCSKGIVTKELDFPTQMRACLFICGSQLTAVKAFIPVDWLPYANETISSKQTFLKSQGILFDIRGIWPSGVAFSAGIDPDEWLSSMLVQPRLFIRIRKDTNKIVSLLRENNIEFSNVTDTCLSLPNGAPIDKLLPADCYVVQDASSQLTGVYFHPTQKETWYDCCSGAGGKSLLLKDLQPSVNLVVSDKRESIIHNLQQRFIQYQHHLPEAIIVDVADKEQLEKKLTGRQFNNIISDVPCTGSGTWARTPEQLYFFDEQVLPAITALQLAIAVNVAGYVKKGGRLIYITCSVFKAENECVIQQLQDATSLTLMEMETINGINKKADSMFIAVLKKG